MCGLMSILAGRRWNLTLTVPAVRSSWRSSIYNRVIAVDLVENFYGDKYNPSAFLLNHQIYDKLIICFFVVWCLIVKKKKEILAIGTRGRRMDSIYIYIDTYHLKTVLTTSTWKLPFWRSRRSSASCRLIRLAVAILSAMEYLVALATMFRWTGQTLVPFTLSTVWSMLTSKTVCVL
jgi:hypothetical protein